MGTHPIFESDFDCLTDVLTEHCIMATAAQIAKLIDEFPSDAALEAYRQQYYDLCRRDNIRDFLIHLAANVKLKGSKFRGLAWKVFLGALGPHKENWIAETKRNREEYQQLLKIYELPKDDDELSGDPLSADDQGQYQVDGWGQKFRDQDLKTLIKQDVDRTIPEVAFFQSNKIRKIMCDILFIYAKSKYLTDLCTVSGKNFTGSISMIIFSR